MHHYPEASTKDVHTLSRAELMSEVVRLREQQSMMIDFCVDAETRLRDSDATDD